MQYLQDHMTPNDVQFIAVQSVEWLGFECIKERSSLKSGRTDILGVFNVKGGQELVTQLLDFQHRLVDLKQQLTYAQQQLERLRQMKRSLSPTKCQMCALMHKITGMLSKRQRKERVQAFQQIVAEINALQAKSQACADYLVLNANSDSRPGCIVVLGNYNQHIICAPSRPPGHPSRDKVPPVINTVSTSDTASERAAAARLIKALLRDRCRVLAESAATIFDLQGRGAAGSGGNGGGMGGGSSSASHGGATRGSLGANEGQRGVNLDTSDSVSNNGGSAGFAGVSAREQGTSKARLGIAAFGASGGHGNVQQRTSWAEDTGQLSHELVTELLKGHLSQPHVYSSLGLQCPPSKVLVSEAQEWLDNMWIIGTAQPMQA